MRTITGKNKYIYRCVGARAHAHAHGYIYIRVVLHPPLNPKKNLHICMKVLHTFKALFCYAYVVAMQPLQPSKMEKHQVNAQPPRSQTVITYFGKHKTTSNCLRISSIDKALKYIITNSKAFSQA